MERPAETVLPLAAVRPDPRNHREHSGLTPDAIATLGDQMREAGQLTAIWAEPHPDGTEGVFQIIAGHRRYYALRHIGAESVRALVFVGLTRAQVADLQASENNDRVNPAPCEEAASYRRMIEARIEDRGHLSWEESFREVVRATGRSAAYLRERLDLLKLPEDVRGWIDAGFLGTGHAKHLVRLIDADDGNAAEVTRIALKAKGKGLTIEEVKARVNAYLEEQAQCSLFGAEEAKDPAATREARSRSAAIVAACERIAANTFDRRGQQVAVGHLRGDELRTLQAELEGAQSHLRAVLAETQRALGQEPDLSPGVVAETVDSQPVEATQAAPAVGVAQEGAGRVQGPQNAPGTPVAAEAPVVRQAVLTPTEPVTFGAAEGVRVSMVGQWLWVFGVAEPGRSSLAYAVQRAGGRWASGRQAWYSPHPAEQAAIQEVLREYLSETSEPLEQAAVQAAGG